MTGVLVLGTGDTTATAASTMTADSEPTLYLPYYQGEDLPTNRERTSTRIRETTVGVGVNGGNATVTFDATELANAGVDFSGASANVTATRRGVDGARAWVNASAETISVEVNESSTDGSATAEFDVRISGLDTTNATPTTGLAYGITTGNSSEGMIEPHSENYRSQQNVSLYRPVAGQATGPSTLETGHEAIVQNITLNGSPAEPLSPSELVVAETGTVDASAVESVTVRYGDRWSETVTDTTALTDGGAPVELTGRDTRVTESTHVTVEVALARNATNVTSGSILSPSVIVRGTNVPNGSVTVPDRVDSTVGVPLTNATATAGNETTATTTYRGAVTVANASSSGYETLSLDVGTAAGGTVDWSATGGSFANASLEDVTVTADGTDLVDRNGSLSTAAGGERLVVPLSGNVSTGDRVTVTVDGVENPAVTARYPATIRFGPAGPDDRAAIGPIPVTQPQETTDGVSVSDTPIAYTDDGTRVEVIANRSLAPDAVTRSDFTVAIDDAESSVTDVRLAGNDQRVVLSVDGVPPHEITEITAWDQSRQVTTADPTITPGSRNRTVYTSEPVALLTEQADTDVTVRRNGTRRTLSSGQNSRIAVLPAGFDAGNWTVDWDGDGETDGADVALTAREPSIEIDHRTTDFDAVEGTVPLAVDAPDYYHVRATLSQGDRTARTTNATATEVDFGRQDAGRYDLSLALDRTGEFNCDSWNGCLESTTREIAFDRIEEERRTELDASSVVAGNGRVVTLSDSGTVRALDATSHDERWSRTFDGYDSGTLSQELAMAQDRVFVSLVDDETNTLFALNGTTGDVEWRRNASSTAIGKFTALAAANGSVYSGSYESPSGVVALDAGSGTTTWTNTRVNETVGLDADGDIVAVAPWTNLGLTLDATTGEKRWRVNASTVPEPLTLRTETATIASDSVVYASHDSKIVRANETTGRVVAAASGGITDTPQSALGRDGNVLLARGEYGLSTVANGTSSPIWEYYGLDEMNDVATTGDTFYVVGSEGYDAPNELIAATLPKASISTTLDGPQQVRAGADVTYTARTVGDVAASRWTLPNHTVRNATNVTVSLSPGVHNVSYRAETPSGWVATDERRVAATLSPWFDWTGTVPVDRTDNGTAVFDATHLEPAVSSIAWRFEDGTTVTGANVTRDYRFSGYQTVRATVTDETGWTATRNLSVLASRTAENWTAELPIDDGDQQFEPRPPAGGLPLEQRLPTGEFDVVDGHVYAVNEGELTTFDADDGGRLWSFRPDRNRDEDEEYAQISSATTTADGAIVTHFNLSSSNGDRASYRVLKRLNASGETVWSTRLGRAEPGDSLLGDPVVDDDRVYVVSVAETADGPEPMLTARELASGDPVWNTTIETPPERIALDTESGTIVTTGSQRVTAYDASTGTASWNATLESLLETPDSFEQNARGLVAENGTVYVAGQSPYYLEDGQLLGSGPLTVRALDATTGTQRWHESAFWTGNRVSDASIATVDETVVVGGGPHLAGLNANGTTVFNETLHGNYETRLTPEGLSERRRPANVVDLATSTGRLHVVTRSAFRDQGRLRSTDDVAYLTDPDPAFSGGTVRTYTPEGGHLWTSAASPRTGRLAVDDDGLYLRELGQVRALERPDEAPFDARIDAPSTVTVGDETSLVANASAGLVPVANATYTWEVEGETETGRTVTTSFDTPGSKTVALTVRSPSGPERTVSTSITVEASESGGGGFGGGLPGGGSDDDGSGELDGTENGTGGNNTTADPLDDISTDDVVVTDITDADSERAGTTVAIDETDTVETVTFDAESPTGQLEVAEYDEPPTELADAVRGGLSENTTSTAPSVVTAVDISPTNDTVSRSSATVELTVARDEVNDPSAAVVVHETDTGWERLETTLESADGESVTFHARTDSFSMFAVVEPEPRQDGSSTGAGASTDADPVTDEDQQISEDGNDGSGFGVVGIGAAIVAVIAGIVAVLVRRGR
ncbi:Pyrrolo-quinoline quinone [Natrinema thermotolerans DSM 11552]|nr:Pyrrolo-quinoline quinone [Natrinema thermotolerans DSM 11552]